MVWFSFIFVVTHPASPSHHYCFCCLSGPILGLLGSVALILVLVTQPKSPWVVALLPDATGRMFRRIWCMSRPGPRIHRRGVAALGRDRFQVPCCWCVSPACRRARAPRRSGYVQACGSRPFAAAPSARPVSVLSLLLPHPFSPLFRSSVAYVLDLPVV